MSHSASASSPRASGLSDADEPSPPPAAAYVPHHAVVTGRRDRLSNSGPMSNSSGGRTGKSPHELHRLMSSSGSDLVAQPEAARTATSARSELNTPNSGNRRSLFARGANEAFETSQVEESNAPRQPAWLQSGLSTDDEGMAANSSLTAKSTDSPVRRRAAGLHTDALPAPSAAEHVSSTGVEQGRAGGGAAAPGVARLALPDRGTRRPAGGSSAGRDASEPDMNGSGTHSLEYTSESSGAQDSQRTELAVVQPSATPQVRVDSERSCTGHASILTTSLPSGFMVTMDGGQVSFTGTPSPTSSAAGNASHAPDAGAAAGSAAHSTAGRAGGIGDAMDPEDPLSRGGAASSAAGPAHKAAPQDCPIPAPVGVADPGEPAAKQQHPAASMKHGFTGGMHSRSARGGDSVVRFADEESQPSSKGTTALLKDSSESERNPSYMTNCRMQMLIMEEPPRGARSADYVCYLRKSMDGMRAELHAVMEQTHKAQAWMKRRERLMQLQQGLLRPVSSEIFIFSAPWARLRTRFEGMSRSVAWKDLPNEYHYLRAKSADMALLEEAANELFKVIWRRASPTTHSDIEVSMELQPAHETSVGTAVVPPLAGVIAGSRVNVPSSMSSSCLGCLGVAAERGTAARAAQYTLQHSDEDMMDDSLGGAHGGQHRLEAGSWFRFAIVVRFVDRGPSASSRAPAAPVGSGQESDNAELQLQQQLEGNPMDDFPLNDDEYVGVQIAREVARLHGGHVSFEFRPGQPRRARSPAGRETGITQVVFSVFAQSCNSLEALANDTFALGSTAEVQSPVGQGAGAAASGAGAAAPNLAAANPLSDSDAEQGTAGAVSFEGAAVGASAAAQTGQRPSGHASHAGLSSARLDALFREQVAVAMHPSVHLIEAPMQPLYEPVPRPDMEEGALDRPRRLQINQHQADTGADDPTAGAAAAEQAVAASDAQLYAGAGARAGVHTPPAAAGYQLVLAKRSPSVEALAGPEGMLRPAEELLDVTTADLASKARVLDAVTADGVVLCRAFHPTECRHHVLVVTPSTSTAEALAGILRKLPAVCSYAVASSTAQLEQMVLAPCSKGIPLPTAVFTTSQLGQAHADVLAYFLKRNGLLGLTTAVAMPGEEQALLQLFPQVMRTPCLAPDVSASLQQTRFE